MDFLHPHKKRKQTFQLFLGYGLMAIALSIATFIMVFFTLGYDIDPSTGNVITKGLVILDSHPESADIFINGEYKGTTKARYVLPAGSYTAELRRDGYRSWQHDFTLNGSDIKQLVYPFIFPVDLQTSSIKTYESSPGMISQSPDRRWLIVEQPKLGTFELIDLNDPKNPSSSLTLPSDTLTNSNGKHSLKAVEWSGDSNHLLLEHKYKTGTEFIVLNRGNPLASLNVSKLFSGEPATSISLRDKKANLFYLYNAKTKSLATANSSSGQVDPLLRNVLAYKAYRDDTVLYVRPSTNKKTAEVHLLKNKEDYLIRTIPASENYFLEAAEFEGKFYVVVGSQADSRAYIYKNPLEALTSSPAQSPEAFRVLIAEGAQYVSFSQNTRFVALQGGNNFAVYDIENDRQSRYSVGQNLANNQKATWMDGHRLILVSENKSHVFDFDNTNHQVLDSASAAYQPLFNRDYDAMFSLVPDQAEKYKLNRTELRLNPERFR